VAGHRLEPLQEVLEEKKRKIFLYFFRFAGGQEQILNANEKGNASCIICIKLKKICFKGLIGSSSMRLPVLEKVLFLPVFRGKMK
jgi:hypothetical protein